jgi:hypothetical protein
VCDAAPWPVKFNARGRLALREGSSSAASLDHAGSASVQLLPDPACRGVVAVIEPGVLPLAPGSAADYLAALSADRLLPMMRPMIATKLIHG